MLGRYSRENIINILRDPNLSRINFRVGAVHVYPQGFQTVARLVEHGQIRISEAAHVPDSEEVLRPGVAVYNSDSNSMFFPFAPETLRSRTPNPTVGNLRLFENMFGRGYFENRGGSLGVSGRAVIIHESVHALEDYNRVIAPGFIDETAGYVAQMMYTQIYQGTPPTADYPLHFAANQIASRLLNEHGYSVTQSEIDQMRQVLVNHPRYGSGICEVATYNGV